MGNAFVLMNSKYLPKGPKTSAAIINENLSDSPGARYQREKRLTDDAYCEKQDASVKRHKARLKVAQITKESSGQSFTRFVKPNVGRIAFHLSKGRDIGDIAIRERLMVSKVQEVVEMIQKVKGTK